LGRPPADIWQDAPLATSGGQAAEAQSRRGTVAVSTQHAEAQLRGLIHDFKERQRKAGLVVAGSVASAVALTVATIALVIAIAG
jgi:hypothetical protein